MSWRTSQGDQSQQLRPLLGDERKNCKRTKQTGGTTGAPERSEVGRFIGTALCDYTKVFCNQRRGTRSGRRSAWSTRSNRVRLNGPPTIKHNAYSDKATVTRPPLIDPSPSAAAITRSSNLFTYVLGLLLPRSRRPYFYVWYAYFRLLDDEVDTHEGQPDTAALDLIALERFYARAPEVAPENPRSHLLASLVEFDARFLDGALRRYIRDMILCVEYDRERRSIFPAAATFRAHVAREATSYLGTISVLCTGNDTRPRGVEAGIAGKWIHMLRDFRRDVANGIFNIPSEELNDHHIVPPWTNASWSAPETRSWVERQCHRATSEFDVGLADSTHHVSGIYTVIVILLCAKYRTYLRMIYRDGYHLRREYRWSVRAHLEFIVDVLVLGYRLITRRQLPR